MNQWPNSLWAFQLCQTFFVVQTTQSSNSSVASLEDHIKLIAQLLNQIDNGELIDWYENVCSIYSKQFRNQEQIQFTRYKTFELAVLMHHNLIVPLNIVKLIFTFSSMDTYVSTIAEIRTNRAKTHVKKRIISYDKHRALNMNLFFELS